MLLITGASGGIGFELFKKLSIKNDVIAISNRKKIENNARGICVNVNLLNHNEIDQLISKYGKTFDEITVLNLAVQSFDGLLANYPIEKVRETFELNLISNLYLLQGLLPIMLNQKWGRIIHFSSIVGNEGAKGAGIYAASKSALIGYSKTLSKEYGRFGITSNIIELGYFEKGLIENFNKEKIKNIISNTSSRRLGVTDDIIHAIKFIQKSDFYNGEILKLNGGK
ncbi:MAG: SDR family oxidoreductase [Prochlorococcus marinus CUG1439]|uniref:SDR family NAD(P)-dependent oxidoreductase n=1 Tax=Prochlorococcus sp. MIT 1314 TaxID=3096220 RepID=UPI001B1FA743|nr:SDR family oxidoreductase [Prochlorococcus sp. MIT 1314]MCR8538775.1 SDR family oxidoreductase [Prochlorococcus marinus CUG1439]